VPEEPRRQRRYDRLCLAFEHFVTGYDHAGNLLVVKTAPGTAAAVAADLDAMQWREVVGTVAGDDTILIVVRSAQGVKRLHKRLQDLLGLSTPPEQSA
jgi:transcriptional regulator of arginine metabolism